MSELCIPNTARDYVFDPTPAVLTPLVERSVRAFGLARPETGWEFRWRDADNLLVICPFDEGLTLNGRPVRLGTLVLLRAGQSATFRSVGDGRLGWFVLEPTGRWRNIPPGVKTRPIATGRPDRWSDLMRSLGWELLQGGAARGEQVARGAAEILGCYLECSLKVGAGGARWWQRLDELWTQVARSPQRGWTLDELAEVVGVSRSQLHRRVKQAEGVSPMQRVRSLRMQRVAELLTRTDWTLEQIAPRVGYACPFALSKAFKRTLGSSPEAYRAAAHKRST